MAFGEDTPRIDEVAYSLHMYAQFIAFELREAQGATTFRIFHPAPEDVPIGELEILAEQCREAGYNAAVRPIEREDGQYFGIDIVS